MRIQAFQADLLETLLASGVRVGGLQIPRKNGKSALCAAIGLWALCDDPDGPQVPLISGNSLQVERTLFRPVVGMIEANSTLGEWVKVRTATGNKRVESAWNGGVLLPLPADHDKLQGLNPSVALLDEAQTVPVDVQSAIEHGSGARTESLTLSIGTPRLEIDDSTLWLQRQLAQAGAPIAWIEHAAPDTLDWRDPAAWWAANPALRAGLISRDVFEQRVATVGLIADVKQRMKAEQEFDLYRLGRWLPPLAQLTPFARAWQSCEQSGSEARGAVCFAVDVGPDGVTPTSIVAVGGGVVELVDRRPGTEWVVERCVELVNRYGGQVLVDANGPIGAREPDLMASVAVLALKQRDLYRACHRFAEDVEARRVVVRPCEAFVAAAAGAQRFGTGDTWRWARRRSTEDIAPLVAATLAWWGSLTQAVPAVG